MCLALKFDLLTFECLLVFLVDLVATFVVATIMDEYASVTKATISVLVVILAAFWVMIHTCRNFHKCRRFLWSFQCSGKLFLFQVILCLDEIVRIAILTSIYFRIELSLANGLRNCLVLLSIEETVFFFLFPQVLLSLCLVNLLDLFRFARAGVIIG